METQIFESEEFKKELVDLREKARQCNQMQTEVVRLKEGLKALKKGMVDVVVNDNEEISFVIPQSKIEQQDLELELLFENMMNAFAYLKIVNDENGDPADYTIIRINSAFGKIIGAEKKDLIGKKIFEVLPVEIKAEFSWIKTCGNVVPKEAQTQFEQQISFPTNKWYKISSYSPQNGYFAVVMSDVTQQKLAEQALRESERSLTKAQEIAHLGNWVYDIDAGNMKWSDETYRILKLPMNDCDITPALMRQIIHPEDLEKVSKTVRDAIEQSAPFDLEHRIVRTDGEVRFVHMQAELTDQNGQSKQMIGTIHDITERKQVEFELRKLSQAVEQSPASVIITDVDGKIDYVNSKFVEVTGYTAEEAIGKKPSILKSGNMPPEVYKEMWSMIKQGGNWQVEFENKKKSGELFWENALISPIKDTRGKITNYLALKEDITQRKLARRALNAMHVRFEKTIDALSSEVCIVDESGKILYINEAWRNFYKQNSSSNTFPQFNYFQVCQQAADEGVPEALEILSGVKSILDGEKSNLSLQYTCHSKDKTIKRWFVVSVTSFESNNKKYLVFAHENVSQSVLREKAENDRLIADQANQAKSEFLASMSHEFRTPLNGILGFTQTAFRNAKREKLNVEKALEYFKEIHQSGTHLKALVNDILDLAKIESGVLNLRIEEVKLHQVVESIWSNFEQKAIEKKLELENVIPSDLPFVKADRNKLAQVFLNLIGNAIKFTETGTVAVSAKTADTRIVVSVKDTGIGIPEKWLKHVFSKFIQVGESYVTKTEGTGLGLAITQKLIQAMQGEIWVSSKLGEGSTFSFSLKTSCKEQNEL